ncbi:MAG: magnesium transporter [Bauldia sp.]
MAEEAGAAPAAPPPGEDRPIRDGDGHLVHDFIDAVQAAVEAGDRARVLALAGDLHAADTAALIEALPGELRSDFAKLLGDAFDFAALTELDESVRVQIVEDLPADTVAEGVAELDSDDAVYILEDLDDADREKILAEMPAVDRIALKRSLDYPEESAGRRMRSEFVAVPQFWNVGQTIDHLRESGDLPDDFNEVFVVDPAFKLLGTVLLGQLLRAQRLRPMVELMTETRHVVHATENQEEVARRFERYNLISAPVLDEEDRLVGVLTIDDVVDVIQEEVDEDIKRLAGVGDEDLSDTVLTSSRSRLPWLVVNSITAILAASVIGLFDGTIQEMVALAALMPIVASMGGNTGTQAMTVTVRAIATRELGRRNTWRIIRREAAVGFLNGVVIAALVGLAAGWWFGDVDLGVVIAVALVVNMLVAGLAGVLVPLTLNRLKVDPAVASAVFVTTVTDIIGFSAFLGLATWWFGLI